jgi:hypothetical protein
MGAGIQGVSQASHPPSVISRKLKIKKGRNIIILKSEVNAFKNILLF